MNQVLETFAGVLTNPNFYANIIAVTPPILLASLGCAVAQKANVTNMGMEGIMLVSSFVGVICSAYIGGPNPWLELVVGIVVGGLLGLVVAYFHLKLKVDIVLVGIAMNLIGSGGTAFFMYVFTGDRSSTNSLNSGVLPQLNLTFLQDIPVIGPILGSQNILTWLSFLLIGVISFLLFKTKLGLRIRAVGENANAAESVGISSVKVKTIALLISGMIGGMGGVYMSAVYVSYFAKGIVAGRGFIGLAACSMGDANPLATSLSAILFGFFYALSNFARNTGISDNLVKMWPYVATVIGVVLYSINKTNQEKKRLAGQASLEEKYDRHKNITQ
jgi:general nucleoside transport system permease protein